MSRLSPLLFPVAAGLVAWWFIQDDGPAAARGAGGSSGAWGVNPSDVNALSRMIRVELRGGGTAEEKIGMAQVAINRAFKSGCRTLESVVTGGCGGAFSGDTAAYNRLLRTAVVSADDVQAANLALQGVNIVGRRTHFVHPYNAGFSTPSEKRPMRDPVFGRYLPLWSISQSYVGQGANGRTYRGKAQYEPLPIGRKPTLFS